LLKKEEIIKGLLIRWEADRPLRSWSAVGVVTEVRESGFKVLSLDDFQETEWLGFSPDGCLGEMTPCSLEEVKEAIKDTTHALEDDITEKKRGFKHAKGKLKEYKSNVKEFLSGQAKKK
jgi:predicted transcriptional regulator with HTH domain